jgi:pimeloyl-ACP methyl ester carboxylesterase
MNKKVKLILIPGMDGTGLLFEPLIKLMNDDYDYEVICLNAFKNSSAAATLNIIEKAIGDEEVIVIAESYSGHIAHQLSLNSNLDIKHIIYAASFLENPTILTYFRCFLPLWLIRSDLLPTKLIGRLFFGKNKSPALVSLFLKALESVKDKELKSRLEDIRYLKLPLKISDIPSTYVLANQDYLIRKKCVDAFELYCSKFEYKEAIGGHFIVQSNPNYFIELIEKLIAE